MKLDILAIGVHPDDIELSCAGVLLIEKNNGKNTGIIDLTKGELGTRGSGEIRLQESVAAAKILKVDVRENLGMADGFFQNDEAHQRLAVAALRKYQPEIVLCNAKTDRHPDHGRSAKLISDAAFLSGLSKVQTFDKEQPQQAWRPKHLFHYVQDKFIEPDFVIDVTDVFDEKIAAIKAYGTQFYVGKSDGPQTYISTPDFLESVIYRHKWFGKMIGVKYAEGFVKEKMVGFKNFNGFI